MPASMLLLLDDDVERLLTPARVIEALEEMYGELGAGTGVYRPRARTCLAIDGTPYAYRFNSQEGGASRLGYFALRINSSVMQWSEKAGVLRAQAADTGGARFQGFVMLFSLRDGMPVMVAATHSLSVFRVAGSSALAAKHLARPDAGVMGLIGSGSQAVAEALTMPLVRPIKRIRVWSPNPEHRRAFIARVNRQSDAVAEIAESVEDVVVGSDIVNTCTNSYEPVFDPHWLAPGMHVNAINQLELPRDIDSYCHRVVAKANQSGHYYQSPQLGETPESVEYRGLDWSNLPELGDLLSGKVAGRASADEITLFRNNEGLGCEFAAVGAAAYSLARTQGVGREIPLDGFLNKVESQLFGPCYWHRSTRGGEG